MEKGMGSEHSFIARVENTWGTGDRIKCTEKVSCIILVKKLPMMESGKMTSFPVTESYTIRKWLLCELLLIIATGLMWKSIG